MGAILYWAEGSKDKSYDRRERVVLINSDERLIRIFLQWLELLGVPRENLRFRLSIHESACIEDAEKYWAEVVGVTPDQFDRATIKRSKASTVRCNVGADYHGCAIVTVLKSAVLYRHIEGWVRGIDRGAERFSRRGGPKQPPRDILGASIRDGVIGSTSDFGSDGPGSSPGRGARQQGEGTNPARQVSSGLQDHPADVPPRSAPA